MDTLLSVVRAFAVGGAICVIAQILIDKSMLTPARILVLYVVSGVILGAMGWFTPLKEFAGAGATVPLCGFGALIAKGVREAIDRDGPIGILTGGLGATAGGITAALLFSYLASVLTRGGAKR